MKRIFALTALAFGMTNTAMAEPVYMDFTGLITATSGGGAPEGTAISGGFTFDTDRMFRNDLDLSSPYRQITYTDFSATGFADPIAYVNLAGQSSSWGTDGNFTYGWLGLVDTCTPTACLGGWAENLSWNADTNSFVSGQDGTYTQRYISVLSTHTAPIPDFPYKQTLDYFDGNTVTAFSGVTLPLYDLIGLYSESTYECAGGSCTTASQYQYNFSIDSIDRGIGARPVPEPGTTGLLAAALGGLMFFRRRRPT
jgi:hypothetical protein